MKIEISDDFSSFLRLSSDFPKEISVVRTALTTEIPDAWLLKKMGSVKNTERCFMSVYNTVSVGLWLYILKMCKRYDIPVELSEGMKTYINSFQFDFDEFNKYVDDLFESAVNEKGNPFKPYDYQIDAAYKLLKYKRCCGELSTSSGKTLISFVIFKYLLDVVKVKKILYIVPSVDLAEQSASQYQNYESFLKKHTSGWEAGILRSGLRKKERAKVDSCNILFGTYQSLCKKPVEFFTDFNALIIDECHHTSATSMIHIINKMYNLKYSIGVTGTFPKDGLYENLVIQSYVGPVVHTLSADELINKEKRGTPIYVIMQYLDWASLEDKKAMWLIRSNKDPEDINAGAKVLKMEQKFVNSSYTRLKYICDCAIKTKKNTLVLFGDIKGGYGRKLYDYIKENSEKNVFYVDGGTKPENREWMKEQMEQDVDGNTVMVASIGTMGEGIDMKNLWCIFLVNTAKSERIIRQICGRGLRLYEGKTKVVLFDFVDDMKYSENKSQYENYMIKHGRERKQIYVEQNFPVYEQKVSFNVGEALF